MCCQACELDADEMRQGGGALPEGGVSPCCPPSVEAGVSAIAFLLLFSGKPWELWLPAGVSPSPSEDWIPSVEALVVSLPTEVRLAPLQAVSLRKEVGCILLL